MRSLFPNLAVFWVLGCLFVPASASTQPTSTADETLARARELYAEGGPTAALPVYHEALTLYRASGDPLGESITLGLIGNCHKRLGNYDQALELLNQALLMKRELGNRLEEGKTLSHLGLLYWEQADYEKAIQLLAEALAIGKETENTKLQGAALNNLSLVYDELGDYERSLEQYRLALELFRGKDSPEAESYILGNIGGVHLLLGHYREAMKYYEQALTISERLGANPSISQDLGNLALCHLGLGEIPEALAKLDRALELARESGLAKEEADWLKAKGDVLLDVGRHRDGLALYNQALATYEAAGLQRELTEALNEVAALHMQLGDLETAEERLQRSLALAREIDFTRGVLADLLALGELEWRRQRYEEAADFLQQALAGARALGDPNLEATCRTQLAIISRDQQRLDPALTEARMGLELAQSLDSKLQQAAALYTLGDIELRKGEPGTALERFQQGTELVQELGEPDSAWRLAHSRGRALEALGRHDQAVAAYKEAVRLIETVRGRLYEERFRAGYIEDKHEVYIDLARLLVQLDQPEQAFSYAEKLRARSYLDLLSRDHIPGLSEDQRRREEELRQRVRRLRRSLEEELEPSYEPRRQAIELFAVELDRAESDYQDFLSGLRDADPDLANTWSLAVPDEAAIRAALAPDSALLEFVVGNDGVLVFALTADRLTTHSATLPRTDLRAKVELLRQLIRRRDSEDWQYPARSLAESLIQPLLADPRFAAIHHLVLVPHDVLHYLPFAVLPPDNRSTALIQDYRLSYLPSAGALVLGARREAAANGVLAMAPESARLRHTATEARSVAKALAGSNLVLVGEQATESSFKTLAGDYSKVHLATHNTWNRLNPLLSALQLAPGAGEDGRLEVYEILDLELPAELVTLSACETAMGSGYRGATPVGDDFVGLTRAFLYAGSRTVVASLWEVDDRSALDLMTQFYAGLAAGEDPAAALADAQRTLFNRSDGLDPYRWAAFVAVGGAPF